MRGDDQVVYVYTREDLDTWATAFGRPLDNGCFGENLTTAQLDRLRAPAPTCASSRPGRSGRTLATTLASSKDR